MVWIIEFLMEFNILLHVCICLASGMCSSSSRPNSNSSGGIVRGQGRKRAFSNSPYSDSLDFSMLRFSSNSLASLMSCSRSSSASSGSFGHLPSSPVGVGNGLSPNVSLHHGMTPHGLQQLQADLFRSGAPSLLPPLPGSHHSPSAASIYYSALSRSAADVSFPKVEVRVSITYPNIWIGFTIILVLESQYWIVKYSCNLFEFFYLHGFWTRP